MGVQSTSKRLETHNAISTAGNFAGDDTSSLGIILTKVNSPQPINVETSVRKLKMEDNRDRTTEKNAQQLNWRHRSDDHGQRKQGQKGTQTWRKGDDKSGGKRLDEKVELPLTNASNKPADILLNQQYCLPEKPSLSGQSTSELVANEPTFVGQNNTDVIASFQQSLPSCSLNVAARPYCNVQLFYKDSQNDDKNNYIKSGTLTNEPVSRAVTTNAAGDQQAKSFSGTMPGFQCSLQDLGMFTPSDCSMWANPSSNWPEGNMPLSDALSNRSAVIPTIENNDAESQIQAMPGASNYCINYFLNKLTR